MLQAHASCMTVLLSTLLLPVYICGFLPICCCPCCSDVATALVFVDMQTLHNLPGHKIDTCRGGGGADGAGGSGSSVVE